MSGASRPTETAALQSELLGRLGLPAGATPEQIDDVHYAVSQFLAAAPASLRPWAHAQAAALDEAYLLLTDPAGLQGSALRSPTRPPTVVPGGPATPPARRGLPAGDVAAGSVAAGALVSASDAPEVGAEEATDFESLYAAVTPSAHSEMGPEVLTAAERNRRKRAAAAALAVTQPATALDPAGAGAANSWKRFALVLGGVIAVVALLFVGYNLGGGGAAKPGGSGAVAAASATAPVIDEQKVAALMAKLQANPKDVATLVALGDEYYAAEQFQQSGSFYDQALAIDPKNIQALLARGAVYFNLSDLANAEKTWKLVVAIEPNNQEVHYDLGFLYLNQPTPNLAGVQTEWYAVVKIDPTTSLAKTVQSHLDSLVTSSMIPATPGPSGSASGSPSASSSAAIPSSSVAPSGSPAPSPSK